MYYKFIYLWICKTFLQKPCFTIIFYLSLQRSIIYWYLSLIKTYIIDIVALLNTSRETMYKPTSYIASLCKHSTPLMKHIITTFII